MKKYLIYALFVVSVLFAFETANNIVYADTPHTFSLRAYNCNKLNASLRCVDDNNEVISNPPQLTSGSQIEAGKMIKLELYYVPGLPRTISMQIGITYDPTQIEPFYRNGSFYAAVNRKTTDDGGIWPPSLMATPDDSFTDWTVQSNDYVDGHMLRFLVKDPTQETFLETSGVIATMYVQVKDTITAGEIINLNVDGNYTKVSTFDATYAPKSVSGLNLEVYKEMDSDTSLKALTVTSGSTNYLTNFDKDTKTYSVYVPNNVSSVTVTGTPNKETTTAINDPSGAQTLSVSTTKTVIINTTAESGDTDIYTVNIYRLDNNSYLSNLGLNSGATISPAFSATTTSYTSNVSYTTSSITPTVITAGNNATVSGTTAKQLNVGDNTISIVVSPENCKSQYSSVPGNTCQTRTYTITVNRAAPDTNAYLTDLKIAGVSVPDFSKTTYEYTIDDVSNATTSVTVASTKESSLSTLSGDTTSKSLVVGNNQIKVTVTAEDGTTKHTYTVNIKRKSNDANLKTLTVTSTPGGTLSPASFSPSTTSYTYTVGPDVTEVQISATPNYDGASVAGTGTYNPNTDTDAQIIVTPEDGEAKIYTVNLVRTKSTDVTLDELSVAGYTLSPSYSDSVNSYNVTVPSTETSVNVTATPHDSRTTASVSGGINLTTGNNTVTVTVTPENGEVSARTITITVKKLDGDATLKTLSLSGVTITPTFTSGTKEYTATVPYTTSSTTVSATTNKTTTTITSGTGSVNLTAGAATTIKVKTKAEDPNITDEYTVVVTRTAASTDNTLSDLKVDGVTVPEFDPDTLTYTLDAVSSTKDSVDITATVHDELATIVSGTGSKTLTKNQNNALEVVVKSEAGVNKTYTVNIRRQNDNAFLNSLNITSSDGILDKAFNKNTTAYTYTVGPNVTEVSITGACEDDENATVTGNGVIDPRTVTSKTITCTAEDTNIFKDYVITIVRNKSQNVLLSNLEVSGYDINFNPNTNEYNLNVDSDVSSVTVIATKAEESQTLDNINQVITMNNPGDYSASVTVTAEDTTKANTYKVNIHKYSANASLESLSLDGITLSPAFSANNTEYTATVPYTKALTTISATPISGATIVEGSDIGEKTIAVGGANTYTVTVKAEDGHTTNAYTITVTRIAASTDAYLTDLKVDGSTVPEFDGQNKFTYNIADVPSNKNSVTISATANENSTLSGDLGEKTLTVGNNTFTVYVTPQDESEPVAYTINIKKLNNDNKLSGLTLDNVTLDQTFDPEVNNYTATVPYTVTETDVHPILSDDNASFVISGDTDLSTGENIITIIVTSEDESVDSNTYTITINREEASTDAYLTDLKVDGTSVAGFNKDTKTYTVNVSNATSSVTISATANENSTVTGDTGSKNLSIGDNEFEIVAVAQDGTTRNPYTLTIKRLDNNNNLESLSVTSDPQGTLDIPFDPDTTEYTYIVGPDADAITVTADPEGNATVEGEGEYNPKTTDTITITVTPEEGDAKTYTIHVDREKSKNNELLSLGVEGYSITPSFDKDVTSYTLSVPRDVDKVTITAEVLNSNSSIDPSNLGEKDLNPGTNTFNVTVIPEDPDASSKTYTIVITRVQGTDATLSNITVDGDPIDGFDPDILEYTLPDVGDDVEVITIGATPTDDNATVAGDGAITLSPGENRIPITVTPEDPNSDPVTYTVIVNKALNDNIYLKNLLVNGTSVSEFNKETNNYTVNVPVDTETVSVSAEPEVETSTVSGTGAAIALTGDSTEITITVISQKGTENPYKVTVNKVDDAEYITSEVYGHTIADGMIKTVAYKTKSNELKDQLDNDNSLLFMYKADDSEIYSDDEPLATGVIVKLIRNNTLKDSKLVVVKGDVDGNGRITLFDAVKVLNHFLEKEILEGIYYEAADVDSNGSITLFDAVGILRIFLNDNE